MKVFLPFLLLASAPAVASECIDISGRYLYAGPSDTCRLDTGEYWAAYPIPFLTYDRPVEGTIVPGTEIRVTQIGCEAIHLAYPDARGVQKDRTLSLLPDPDKNGRISFENQQIEWKERYAYRGAEPPYGNETDYRISATFKFALTPEADLQLDARHQTIKQILFWPFAEDLRISVSCRLARAQ